MTSAYFVSPRPAAELASTHDLTHSRLLQANGTASKPSSSWKFPSSRKFLWDRTPYGQVECIQPKVSD